MTNPSPILSEDALAEIEVALDSIEDAVRGSLATGFSHGPLTVRDYAKYEQRVRADAKIIRTNIRTMQEPQASPELTKERAILNAAKDFVDQYLFTGLEDGECSYAIKRLVDAVRIAPPQEQNSASTDSSRRPSAEGAGAAKVASASVLAGPSDLVKRLRSRDAKWLGGRSKKEGEPICLAEIAADCEEAADRIEELHQANTAANGHIGELSDQLAVALSHRASPVDRAAVIEECAIAARQIDRLGYEWVKDSLWDNITARCTEAIRALAPVQDGKS